MKQKRATTASPTCRCAFEEAGLVDVTLGEDGGGEVSLTAIGRATWLQLTDDPG
jgi:hypothetical protein